MIKLGCCSKLIGARVIILLITINALEISFAVLFTEFLLVFFLGFSFCVSQCGQAQVKYYQAACSLITWLSTMTSWV